MTEPSDTVIAGPDAVDHEAASTPGPVPVSSGLVRDQDLVTRRGSELDRLLEEHLTQRSVDEGNAAAFDRLIDAWLDEELALIDTELEEARVERLTAEERQAARRRDQERAAEETERDAEARRELDAERVRHEADYRTRRVEALRRHAQARRDAKEQAAARRRARAEERTAASVRRAEARLADREWAKERADRDLVRAQELLLGVAVERPQDTRPSTSHASVPAQRTSPERGEHVEARDARTDVA